MKRDELIIDYRGMIDVSLLFGEAAPDWRPGYQAMFVCRTCQLPLEDYFVKKEFRCPTCDIDMTYEEGARLCNFFIENIQILSNNIHPAASKPGFWKRLFGG